MSIKLPTMLAFERKLETSDALMMSGDWEHLTTENPTWLPIKITKRQNRSTQSAYGASDENKTKPNPVSSDSDDANLPNDKDTLKVSFTLRIVGNLGEPFGCNDPNFEEIIKEKVSEYKQEGLKELSHRYAHNIASGRFLWRNRVCAKNISIQIRINDNELPITFDGYEFPLNDFDAQRENNSLKTLSNAIFQGLESINDFACLQVDAFVQLGKGQHVFPSQEMNMGEKKKVLFKLDDCAALHSVKVGNAIRTIDNWYDDAKFPIAVEPFGSVTQRGQAYRKSKIDLYTLMIAWVNNKDVSGEQKNFVLANLIRGGVFGGKAE
ncbi:type I-F CRISPR-associated protein Csy3 [Paraglaciecola polaris]|uniref:CRISPR-associated protein, Csy3 family n=1 Tax=Paraglaciecola polaris LMG 21857 TaxID=1129793 RepID=K7A0G1_9ALTE|nr:type I-F CRISPR-associated protein Csy3 [Paraglaciecola polaris]GAC34443.1 CRISPR-associated protein, Csy3 family [Paraglaciecola polaris LMG 21857]